MESLINTGRSESFVDLNETDLALSRSVLNQGRDMFMSYQGKESNTNFIYRINTRSTLTSNFCSLTQVMASTIPKVWPMNRSVERPNSMESVSFVVCTSSNCPFSTLSKRFPLLWGTFFFQRKRDKNCFLLWFSQQIRCCLLLLSFQFDILLFKLFRFLFRIFFLFFLNENLPKYIFVLWIFFLQCDCANANCHTRNK